MSLYADAAIVVKAFIFMVSAFALFAGPAVGAEGADSQVNVIVCPTADLVQFSVTQPVSDSIVSESSLVVAGSTSFVSQVDIYIDDSYNNTLALNYADSSFDSTISLRPGTNTIKVVATGTCGVATIEKSVVVTYQPKVESSIGKEVATVVGEKQAALATPAVEAIPEKSPVQQSLDAWVVTPLTELGKSLDIVSLPDASSEVKWQNTGRSLFFVLGSGLTFVAGYIWLLGAAASSRLSFLPSTRYKLVTSLAVTGLGILALVFML
jgi:hypothetical protein